MKNNNIPHDAKLDHISVCICTFHRQDMLARALAGVISQVSDPGFSFEVVVVDNDSLHSAENTVRHFQSSSNIKIVYDCEPEQSISLARNKTIQNATGNLIAFIDDDEFPDENWLMKMYYCLKDHNADAVLGPVLPDFPAGAPEWLKKSGLCERRRNVTGSPISSRDMRTGNILFQRHVFEKNDMWFDPSRGLTGGSDGEFIGRQIKRGRRFVWCDEAIIFETVTEDRCHASFYLKRYFRIGTIAGERLRLAKSIGPVIKSFALLLGYSFLQPILFFTNKHIWIKTLVKLVYNIGFVLSYTRVLSAKYRQ